MTSLDPQTLAEIREYLRREDALAGLAAYQGYMAATGLPDFQHGPADHHRVILPHLEALERGDIERLMIAMPPGSGKSVWGNVTLGSWWAARNPQHQIIATSATLALAEEFAARRKLAMASPEWRLLTGVDVDARQATGFFRYGNGGSQFACGVGGSVVGRRADLLLIDDAIASHEQVSAQSAREKQWNWYVSEASTRLTKGGRVLVVCTRWWSDDLMGRLIETEGDQWTVLELPMLCTDPDSDPMGRAEGVPLWPGHYSPQRLADAQRDPVLWQSLWQQKPLNQTGDWLDPSAIKVVDAAPPLEELTIYAAMDLAASESDKSDYTVIGVVGIDHQRRLWILDWFRGRIPSEEIVLKLRDFRDRWQPLEYLIDDDIGSRHFSRLAGSMAMLAGGAPLLPRMIPTKGKSKEARAVAFQSMARMGLIHTLNGPWVPVLLHEIGTFPRVGRGYHDDQVDVLSLLCNFHTRMSPGSAPYQPTGPEPIQGNLQSLNGQVFTTATFDELWEDRRSGGILRI